MTGAEPVYHQYVVRVPATARQGVRARLAEVGIGRRSTTRWPSTVSPPLHGARPLRPPPVTEEISGLVLSLPIGLHVGTEDATRVARALADALGGAAHRRDHRSAARVLEVVPYYTPAWGFGGRPG